MPCGSESCSTLPVSSSVISSDSETHNGGNVINDTKKEETIIVCVCTHDNAVPVRPVEPAPLPSTSVAVSAISGSGSADDNTAAIISSSAQPN